MEGELLLEEFLYYYPYAHYYPWAIMGKGVINIMESLSDIWAQKGNYNRIGLINNPFSITPLFQHYTNIKLCEKDEALFVITKKVKKSMQKFSLGRRIVVYGEIGVGKTSLINMLLYLSYKIDNYFPIRIILAESNVERCVQEILYTICYEFVKVLNQKKISKPINLIKKTIIERRNKDKLYEYLAKLSAKSFEEGEIKEIKEIVEGNVKVGVPGVSGSSGVGREVSTIKSFKSYVEDLTPSYVRDYLSEISDLIKRVGFKGVIIAIDEADHIGDLEKIIDALTITRDVFFVSEDFTYIFCCSPEMILHKKQKEIIGIFDSEILVEELDLKHLEDAFSRRIERVRINSNISLHDIFNKESLKIVHKASDGRIKIAIKIAQNVLDEFILTNDKVIQGKHIIHVLDEMKMTLKITFDPSEQKVMKAMEKLGEVYASHKELQTITGFKRTQLGRILQSLKRKGVASDRQVGKKNLYRLIM